MHTHTTKRRLTLGAIMLTLLFFLSGCGTTGGGGGSSLTPTAGENSTDDTSVSLPTALTLSASGPVLIGQDYTVTVTTSPGDASNSVTWAISPTATATISDGIVEGLQEGIVTISATSTLDDSVSASITRSVVIDYADPTSITMDPETIELELEVTASISADVQPPSANPSVTWSSSNDSIATVSEAGIVTAVAVGEATITATSEQNGGIMGTTVITVVDTPEVLTFTTSGATGKDGPTQEQIDTEYTGDDPLAGNVVINTQGIQEWTVPETGTYTITAAGAKGGSGGFGTYPGGSGRIISANVTLTQGDTLKVVVGQAGQNANYGGSGGGGTFVYTDAAGGAGLIIAAGGGGGGQGNNTNNDGDNDKNANFTNDGNTSRSTNSIRALGGISGGPGDWSNNNGSGFYSGGPGAGWNGSSANGSQPNGGDLKGKRFTGGSSYEQAVGYQTQYDGGFGGGGAAGAASSSIGATGEWAGGGGGYSGGAAGFFDGDSGFIMGGGAGSYILGTAVNPTDGGLNGSANGYVIITY